MHRPSAWLLVAALLVTGACDRNSRGRRTDLDPGPDPLPTPGLLTTEIVYRVTGTVARVKITYFSSTEGTIVTVSDLPWVAQYTTRASSVFVHLTAEAPPDDFIEGTLIVQVFVNGALFRESTAEGFSPVVEVSGEVVR